MSEHTQYYEAFVARLCAPEGLSAEECRCHGGGWILSDLDTWHACPDHHIKGQRHPEDFDMNELEDDPRPLYGPQEEPFIPCYDDLPF